MAIAIAAVANLAIKAKAGFRLRLRLPADQRHIPSHFHILKFFLYI
jgi:hypothetical protein